MEKKLPIGLAFLALILNGLDNWTTYICLREPVEGFVVAEANPIADFIFQQMGLVPGLLFEYALTIAVLYFIIVTTRVPGVVKSVLLTLLCLIAGYAAWNNHQIIQDIGLATFGA